MKIPLDLIKPSSRPVRTSWDEEKLDELAQSIREQGLIVPVKVRPVDGRYEIVYGHRRVEAMRRIPEIKDTNAIVEGIDDTDTIIQALIENVQREDLEPIDMANALYLIQIETGWSQNEMARQAILPLATINNLMLLLKEPEEIRQIITKGMPGSGGGSHVPEGKITTGHVQAARESVLNQDDRPAILKKAAKEGLSIKQTRQVAESVGATKDPRRREYLLETPYSSFIHDPELNKERAREYGGYDPTSVSREPTPGQQWQASPEVKAIIDLLRGWQDRVPEIKKSVQQGKFSPEAKAFVLRRVEKLIAELRDLAIELED